MTLQNLVILVNMTNVETYISGESDYSDDSGFFGSGELCESGDYGRFVDFCEVTDDSVDFGKSFDFSEIVCSRKSVYLGESANSGDCGESDDISC